jgi:hypothetical protein
VSTALVGGGAVDINDLMPVGLSQCAGTHAPDMPNTVDTANRPHPIAAVYADVSSRESDQ